VTPAGYRNGTRRAFRAFVRAHHPDRGGDPAVFAAGVAAYRRYQQPAGRAGPGRLLGTSLSSAAAAAWRCWPATGWTDGPAAAGRPAFSDSFNSPTSVPRAAINASSDSTRAPYGAASAAVRSHAAHRTFDRPGPFRTGRQDHDTARIKLRRPRMVGQP